MDIKSIKEFIEWSEGIPYIDIVEEFWVINGNELSYELAGDLEFNYSVEVNCGPLRKDGLVVVNCDNGCGETITMILLEENEIK